MGMKTKDRRRTHSECGGISSRAHLRERNQGYNRLSKFRGPGMIGLSEAKAERELEELGVRNILLQLKASLCAIKLLLLPYTSSHARQGSHSNRQPISPVATRLSRFAPCSLQSRRVNGSNWVTRTKPLSRISNIPSPSRLLPQRLKKAISSVLESSGLYYPSASPFQRLTGHLALLQQSCKRSMLTLVS